MVGFWIKKGGAIVGAVGKKFKGQKTKEQIIEAGKKKKEKWATEDFKENLTRYFTNQPPKKTKTKTKTKHYYPPKDF